MNTEPFGRDLTFDPISSRLNETGGVEADELVREYLEQIRRQQRSSQDCAPDEDA